MFLLQSLSFSAASDAPSAKPPVSLHVLSAKPPVPSAISRLNASERDRNKEKNTTHERLSSGSRIALNLLSSGVNTFNDELRRLVRNEPEMDEFQPVQPCEPIVQFA